MTKRKQSQQSTPSEPKSGRVTIQVGLYKGLTSTALYYSETTVIVLVKNKPYVYRHEDVEKVG